MEAITIYVCPQCSMSFTVVPNHHSPPPTRAVCLGVPVSGTWVPEEGFPALVDDMGVVTRIPKNELVHHVQLIEPAQKDDDRQTVVKPKDGDERYWDDEQEKLGR